MELYEPIVWLIVAGLLTVVACYFAWHQRLALRTARRDLNLPPGHRAYLIKQAARRLFGSFLLLVLAGLLVGSLFLDYEPIQRVAGKEPNPESAKQVRLLSFYWMTTLLVLMVIVSVAVIDLWANARFGFQQQKQLMLDHQLALEAELARLRDERSNR